MYMMGFRPHVKWQNAMVKVDPTLHSSSLQLLIVTLSSLLSIRWLCNLLLRFGLDSLSRGKLSRQCGFACLRDDMLVDRWS